MPSSVLVIVSPTGRQENSPELEKMKCLGSAQIAAGFSLRRDSCIVGQAVFCRTIVKKYSTSAVRPGWDLTHKISPSPGALGAWHSATSKVLC